MPIQNNQTLWSRVPHIPPGGADGHGDGANLFLNMMVMICRFLPIFHRLMCCQFSAHKSQVNNPNNNPNNKIIKQTPRMPSKCQQYQAQCQQAAYRVPIVRLPQMHADLIRARYLQNTQYKQPTTGQCEENSHKTCQNLCLQIIAVWQFYKKLKSDDNLPWSWRTYAAPWSLRSLQR